MALSSINRRKGLWSCEGLIPQCRGMPGVGGSGSTLIEGEGGGGGVA